MGGTSLNLVIISNYTIDKTNSIKHFLTDQSLPKTNTYNFF